jgi:hypothetical protein
MPTIINKMRMRRGEYSPTRATAFGMIPPRPMPPKNRMVRNSAIVLTRDVIKVTTEKNKVAQMRTGLRPTLSATMLNRSDPNRMPTSAALRAGPIWAMGTCQS